MKEFTLKITESQLAQISGLVAAAGKAPHTGAEGILAAAEALRWLQEAVDAATANQPEEAESHVFELPSKAAS